METAAWLTCCNRPILWMVPLCSISSAVRKEGRGYLPPAQQARRSQAENAEVSVLTCPGTA